MSYVVTQYNPSQPPSRTEISTHLHLLYVERLNARVKKMRRLLAEREWHELKTQARQLRGGSENFGFGTLSERAVDLMQNIPDEPISRIRSFSTQPQARVAAEALFCAIDQFLTENSVRFR
jgi:HPt (histidine-containing phosphotransfer) domain-containing protein